MAIYTTSDDALQVTTESRLQGWQVQVSKWTGENFDVLYDRYAIVENYWEAVIGGLIESGIEAEEADWQMAEWGIFPPNEDEE